MQRLNEEETQKDIDSYFQLLCLILHKENCCTSADYHKIQGQISFVPISYKTYINKIKQLSNLLNNVGFDKSICSLPDKIFIKRILYLFSVIDSNAFIRDKSNPNGFFSIKDFKMPAIFFPLFIGITVSIGSIGSPAKKGTWHALKSIAINRAEEFFQADILKILSISQDLDSISTIYQYCLNLILPDELYEYSINLENTISKANTVSPIDRLNLVELKEKLYDPDAIFITHYCRENFYSNLIFSLNSYNNDFDKLLDKDLKAEDKSENSISNLNSIYKNSKNEVNPFYNLPQDYDKNVNEWKSKDETLALKSFNLIFPPSGI